MNFEQDVTHIKEGFWGEEIIRELFKKHNIHHFQVDLIYRRDDKYYLAEIKYQEAFEPPPFRGHGLPRWQINARLQFYQKTGVEPYLFVVDKGERGLVYFRSLLALERGDHYDTRGKKPRRIYPIENYKKYRY